MHRKLRPKIKIWCHQPSSYRNKQQIKKTLTNVDNNNKKWKLNRPHATHSRANDSTRVKTKSVLPHGATKYAEVYFRKKYQNTQNNAPKRYAHTVGNRCDSAKCCVAAVYTYKYNINTILSRAIQQRYSQFEGLGKKGRITWPHGGTHLQNEAGAFHAPSVEPDPDPLQKH